MIIIIHRKNCLSLCNPQFENNSFNLILFKKGSPLMYLSLIYSIIALSLHMYKDQITPLEWISTRLFVCLFVCLFEGRIAPLPHKQIQSVLDFITLCSCMRNCGNSRAIFPGSLKGSRPGYTGPVLHLLAESCCPGLLRLYCVQLLYLYGMYQPRKK